VIREELDELHQRIAARLAAKQSAAYNAACEEDDRLIKSKTTLSHAHLMVMSALGEVCDIVREEIENT
jgi:hypothetical protein